MRESIHVLAECLGRLILSFLAVFGSIYGFPMMTAPLQVRGVLLLFVV